MANTKNIKFVITGMTCNFCSNDVYETTIEALKKTIREKTPISERETLNLNWVDNSCTVSLPSELLLQLPNNFAFTDQELQDIITSALSEKAYGCALVKKKDPYKLLKHGIFAAIGIILGLGLMLMPFLGVSIPVFLLPLAPYLDYIIAAIFTGVSSLIGFDTYIDAFKKAIFAKKINMNSLFTISTLTAIGVSIGALFTKALPMLFDSALLILGFRHVGLFIEETAKRKIYSGLKFQQRTAKKVLKVFDAQTQTKCHKECASKDLIVGDIIYVSADKNRPVIIPVDGTFIFDKDNPIAQINENIANGGEERVFNDNEPISAGMEIPAGKFNIKMRVSATAENSNVAVLDRNLTQRIEDRKHKAPIQNTTDTILKWFIPGVIVLSLITAVIVGLVFASAVAVFAWPLAIKIGLTILVSACPCTLGCIAPLSMRIGIMKAAEHHILFKSPQSVQAATELKALALDVTGTITGDIEVVKFGLLKEDHDYIFNIIAELEAKSEHPFGKALHKYATNAIKNKSATNSLKISNIKDTRSGRHATINGANYTIGDGSAMEEIGINTQAYSHLYDDPDSEHVIYLAKDGKIVSHLSLHTPIRPGVIEFVKARQESGTPCFLLSGLKKQPLEKIARKIGIPVDDEHIKAGCISTETNKDNIPTNHKIYHLQKIREKYGKVGMIGDGKNDVRAIQDGLFDETLPANCDLGIAFKSTTGDLITQQNASVVVGGDSFVALEKLFTIASMTITNIKINLGMSFTQNLLTLAAITVLTILSITLPPFAGACIMVGGAALIFASVLIFKAVVNSKMEALDKSAKKENVVKLSSTGTVNRHLDITSSNENQLDQQPDITPSTEIKVDKPLKKISTVSRYESPLLRAKLPVINNHNLPASTNARRCVLL